jgi:hypothetical protein
MKKSVIGSFSGVKKTYLSRVNLTIGKHHGHIVLVHDLAANSTNNSGVGVMAEWNFLSQNIYAWVAHRAVDIMG